MWKRKVTNTEREERWRREDAAPRLAAEVPSLRSLRLRLKDIRGGVASKARSARNS